MSLSSGIKANAKLLSDFSEVRQNNTGFAIVAKVVDEEIQTAEILQGESSAGSPSESFKSNLHLLKPHILPTEPRYFLLRRYNDEPQWVIATYAPDKASAKQKMLVASSRHQLIRDLGREHFRDSIEVNGEDELTPAGFDRLDKHAAAQAPMTEKERTLDEVRRAEAEAVRGTQGRMMVQGERRTSMPMDSKARDILTSIAKKEVDFVILKIEDDLSDPDKSETIYIDQTDPVPSSIDELAKMVSSTQPRFTFYRYKQGGDSAPLLFFYTCPPDDKMPAKDKVLYSVKKGAVIDMATHEMGVEIDKKFDIHDMADLSSENIEDSLRPAATASTGFARPKKPAARR